MQCDSEDHIKHNNLPFFPFHFFTNVCIIHTQTEAYIHQRIRGFANTCSINLLL